MNSHQLIEQIDKLLEIINHQDYFLGTIEGIAQFHETLPVSAVTLLRRAVSTKDDSVEQQAALDNTLDFLIQRIRSIKPRDLFTSINAIENAFTDFAQKNTASQVSEPMRIFSTQLSNFSSAYDEYLNASNQKDREPLIVKLTHATTMLWSSWSMASAIFSDIKNKLEEHTELPEGLELERFSFYLESNMDFNKFSQNLYSINLIYLELCNLLNISANDHPMIIVKIESGSSWVDLLGYPKLIELLSSLIQGAIDYFYRSFTNEGKITALPRKVETLEEIIELRKKLIGIGVDTSEMDAQIQKSSIVIAKELNKLLMGEPRVVINGKTFSVMETFEKRYLEASQRFLLPNIEGDKSYDNDDV